MELQPLSWEVGYAQTGAELPQQWYPAQVPGAVQQDYARANNWPPVEFGDNVKAYAWMEDLYWRYRAPLAFTLSPEQGATLVFLGIDYRYSIRIDSQVLAEGEGMFTPVTVDVTGYAGGAHTLEVLLYPVPKADRSGTRDEARKCCKPGACYGWDWHPRLVSSGLYDQAGLWIHPKKHIRQLEVSYRLSQDLQACSIRVDTATEGTYRVRLLAEGQVAAETVATGEVLTLTLEKPRLWYPVGYGQQFLYTLEVSLLEGEQVLHRRTRRLGFRQSRMVMNADSWRQPRLFPKSRSDAPATLEINGQRVFAKGSNWVNAHLYPGAVTPETYRELLNAVKDANMNILRIWGGGFVNHEVFFELCDEMGIMVWQEFPLACNEYPDEDEYLQVLEQEAVSIVRRLRTHPSVVMWCGGNELFNNWSRMTDQHHALRLLDRVCYTEDRFTPFLMTSPLNGMAHGPYVNYDPGLGKEYQSCYVKAGNTAYTEFGSPGAASAEYIRRYCTQEDYENWGPENSVWRSHFAFGAAFFTDTWLRTSEAEYYFGGYDGLEDLCAKTQWIQAMCYRSYFEEMRKQWPHCAMALNWCFNEPWPCFANNSLVSWPCERKPAHSAVAEALRPCLASLRVDQHLWRGDEDFSAQVWLLNDSPEEQKALTVMVSWQLEQEAETLWGSLHLAQLPARQNAQLGTVSFPLPKDRACKFSVILQVEGHPEMDSRYTYLCRPRKVINTKGMLNI